MLAIGVILLLVDISLEEVISTAQGDLEGEDHGTYVSYVGIPYASIERSADRFKRAGIAPTWSGIRESRSSSECSTAIEECLQLDVHVPVGETRLGWPVLVWVQGGEGQYHPGMFVKEGIIVVRINYRTGPLGFLCLRHESIPGNTGLKDIVLGLSWVRNNIVAFRGSPSNVIVAGQGFGAAMVEALTLSPISEGLFYGAIIQSGSILSPWYFNYDAGIRASKLANQYTDDVDEIASILLNTDDEELEERSKILDVDYFPFGACVERESNQEEAVLTDTPINLLTQKKTRTIPLMFGYNSDEAYVFASMLRNINAVKRMAKDMKFILPTELDLNENEVKQVIKKIKDLYFKGNYTMRALLGYHRDVHFMCPVYRSAQLHADTNKQVFLYQFSHASDEGTETLAWIGKSGAAHSDELAYLFPDKGYSLTDDDGVVQMNLVKLWTNFVKYLNPTTGYEWSPIDPTHPRIYDIAKNEAMKDFPHNRACRLWEDVYHKYYHQKHKFLS